jgi:mono/diheme cytochrome c family protein
MRRARPGFLLLLALLSACSTPLPDPQSAGAQVYGVRCSGCHQLYAPGSLTAAMWELQVERMQPEMRRRGVNPLTEQERYLVLSYLKAHASDAPPSAGGQPAAITSPG